MLLFKFVVVQIWHFVTLGLLNNTTFHFCFEIFHSFICEIVDDHFRRLGWPFLSIIGFYWHTLAKIGGNSLYTFNIFSSLRIRSTKMKHLHIFFPLLQKWTKYISTYFQLWICGGGDLHTYFSNVLDISLTFIFSYFSWV